jgi:type II secretory pathway pseudopilin PulG
MPVTIRIDVEPRSLWVVVVVLAILLLILYLIIRRAAGAAVEDARKVIAQAVREGIQDADAQAQRRPRPPAWPDTDPPSTSGHSTPE